MTLGQAKKLHNGDEVIDKATGESITVLKVETHNEFPGRGGVVVYIEGVGKISGYGAWTHRRIK